MRISRIAACCFAIAAYLAAEDQTTLRNDGKPMHAPFACRSENLDWAGLACADDDPCVIYLELNAIAATAKSMFVAGDLHAQSATLSSVVLASNDGGATWSEPAARVRGASLDQIQFFDAEHGWISGETVYPLPRDPFLLVTTDGGQSWRNRAITEEGGPGSIQRFTFDSPQHGEVVIDAGASAEGGRYRRYETDTFGDSWSIRSATDAAPKAAGSAAAPMAASDFRLTPAKDAYRIEKRIAGKWTPIASFAVVAETCKSEAPPSSESAPPEHTPKEPN